MTAQHWNALTDEDRDRAFNRLDGGLTGFMKLWGWLHYAKAIEEMCREKNAPSSGDGRDAERFRWLLDGGLYLLPCEDHGIGLEIDLTRESVDEAMSQGGKSHD